MGTHQEKMVKKARRKFVIGATTATITAVLLLVLSINLVRLVQVRKQQEETLRSLSDISGDTYKDETISKENPHGDMAEGPPIQGGKKGPNGKDFKGRRGSAFMQYGGRFLVITVDTDGTTSLYANNSDILTTKEASALASKILEDGKETGYREDYRYQIQTDTSGTKMISLLDCSEDAKSLSDLRMVTIAVGLLGILIAFLFILLTSQKAIQPLAESMERSGLQVNAE